MSATDRFEYEWEDLLKSLRNDALFAELAAATPTVYNTCARGATEIERDPL